MTSISSERRKLKALGVEHRRREDAGMKRSYTDARSVNEPASRVFVHISITNPENYSSNDAHARAIEAIGISRFPNTGVSYNRLIMPNGTVYEGQPIGRRGAHTVNNFKRSTCSTSGCPGRGSSLSAPSWNLNYNARSYVICQNVQHSVSSAQVRAVALAIAADMLAGFVKKNAKIHGHRCVSAKSCPGDKMWAQMDEVESLVRQYVSNGLEGESVSANEFWSARDKWPGWIKNVFPDLQKKYPNGYRADTRLTQVYGRSRQAVSMLSDLKKKINGLDKDVWWYRNPHTEKTYGWLARRVWQALWKDIKSPVTGNMLSPRAIWRNAYRVGNEALEATEANGKEIAELRGLVSANNELLQQLIDNPTQLNMEAVKQAAYDGSHQLVKDVNMRVNIEAELPDDEDEDGAEEDA